MKGALTDNDNATWTWDDEDGKQCWGNGGYTGFAYGGASSLTGNSWWGSHLMAWQNRFPTMVTD